jgi:hypothetical protein
MTAGLRFCISDVTGRGAGLGNELVPWARAFLAAQVLGARCPKPAFGLNTRAYWRHFGTPRYDWLQRKLLKAALPVVRFTEADYVAHGGGDVVVALRSFAESRGLFDRQAYVLSTSGMWGGMRHIAAARDFVASQLYLSRFAPGNLLRLRERLDARLPTVGIHVRLGDFAAAMAPGDYRGRFNVSLPLEWYRRVAESIHVQLQGRVQFLIVSDAAPDKLGALSQGLPCIFSGDIPDSDCSDLLALARTDLLVCSVSSFSVWAAFLSIRPYIWYEPNLHLHPEGFASIWGHEAGQQTENSPTRQAITRAQACAEPAQARAWAVAHDGQVPGGAVSQIMRRWDSDADLVQYGVLRRSPVDGAAQPASMAERDVAFPQRNPTPIGGHECT